MSNNAAPQNIDNREGLPLDKLSLGRVAILTADNVEDVEFFYPYYRFIEECYDVDVITPKGGVLKAYRGMELQKTKALAGADPLSYKLLYIPGGLAPDALKEIPEAISFVQTFAKSGKLVGAVCHGPALLAAADLVRGRDVTSWREVEPEITKAGGNYKNEACVEDGQFFTARKPGDLPIEMSRLLERLKKA